MSCMASANVKYGRFFDLHDIEECQNAESKETPLVRCGRECTDESGHDRDDDHKYYEEEIGQWKTRDKKHREENEGRIDEPLNISYILHESVSIREEKA